MIIVEGPDQAGKTTLAKNLCVKFPQLEYRRAPTLSSTQGYAPGVDVWWDEQIEFAQSGEYTPGIYDRCFYISDPIYRLVSARPPTVSADHVEQQLGQLISGVQPLMIFCLPPWEWSEPRVRQEIQQGEGLVYADMEDLRVIHWAYTTAYTLWDAALMANWDEGSSSVIKWSPTDPRYDVNAIEEVAMYLGEDV